MGDRAQYFLEQSLPELQDLQEKKIFTPLEIKAITRKRISFEHALTRKIIRKADFLRYAEYEMNLEALRLQRVNRLQIKGKKSISDWAGPRRIFFIFERATKRFHGDVDLWLQYIDFAKQQKSNKVLGKIHTSMLQYHPTKGALWSRAAQYEIDWNGNMTAARSLMQRGLRLNTDSESLWMDYFSIEVQYLEKIFARRKVLGLDRPSADLDEEAMIGGLEDETSGHISLPKVSQAELEGDAAQTALLKDVEMSTLATSGTNPALQGAIPLAIIHSAIKAMPKKVELLLEFYEIIAAYDQLPFRDPLMKKIVGLLSTSERTHHPKSQFLRTILPMALLKNNVSDPNFPSAFRESLKVLQEIHAPLSVDFVTEWTQYLTLELLARPDLEPNLRKAITLTIEKAYTATAEPTSALYAAWIKFEQDQGRSESSSKLKQEAQNKFGTEHISL